MSDDQAPAEHPDVPKHVDDCLDCTIMRIKARLGRDTMPAFETAMTILLAEHLPPHLRLQLAVARIVVAAAMADSKHGLDAPSAGS